MKIDRIGFIANSLTTAPANLKTANGKRNHVPNDLEVWDNSKTSFQSGLCPKKCTRFERGRGGSVV